MDKKKILIVDDERDVLSVLESGLAAEGYSVITADNGNDAIVLAKSQRPDLIILDLVMPSVDGAEIAATLKEDTDTKDIPFIFLTCLFTKTEEEEDDGRVIGGHVFLAKPYNMEGLLTQIERLTNPKCVHR